MTQARPPMTSSQEVARAQKRSRDQQSVAANNPFEDDFEKRRMTSLGGGAMPVTLNALEQNRNAMEQNAVQQAPASHNISHNQQQQPPQHMATSHPQKQAGARRAPVLPSPPSQRDASVSKAPAVFPPPHKTGSISSGMPLQNKNVSPRFGSFPNQQQHHYPMPFHPHLYPQQSANSNLPRFGGQRFQQRPLPPGAHHPGMETRLPRMAPHPLARLHHPANPYFAMPDYQRILPPPDSHPNRMSMPGPPSYTRDVFATRMQPPPTQPAPTRKPYPPATSQADASGGARSGHDALPSNLRSASMIPQANTGVSKTQSSATSEKQHPAYVTSRHSAVTQQTQQQQASAAQKTQPVAGGNALKGFPNTQAPAAEGNSTVAGAKPVEGAIQSDRPKNKASAGGDVTPLNTSLDRSGDENDSVLTQNSRNSSVSTVSDPSQYTPVPSPSSPFYKRKIQTYVHTYRSTTLHFLFF